MKDGTKRSQPLRANEFPLGLPNLSQSDQQRVFWQIKFSNSVDCMCKSWIRSGSLDHRKSHQFTDVDLEFFTWAVAKVIFVNMYACAYGSARKKLTSFFALFIDVLR